MAFEDTFTRADNALTLGSPWIVQPAVDANGPIASAFGIESNQAAYTGFRTTEPEYLMGDYWATVSAVVDVGSADMVVEWDLSTTSNVGFYLPFRCAGPMDTLMIVGRLLDSSKLAVHEFSPDGTSNSLGVSTVSGWRDKRVRVEAVGSAITVKVDGTPVASYTSTHNLSVPYAGISGDAISLGGRGQWSSGYPSGGEVSATVDLGSPIQTCEWEFDSDSAGYTYHVFRYVDDNNYWFVYRPTGSPTTLDLYQRVSGANSRVARATGVSWPNGSVVRVEASSTNIVIKIDGSTVITYTTAAGSGDRAGLGGYTASGMFGQWTRFYGHGSITYETYFDRVPGTGLGPEWSTPSATWTTSKRAPTPSEYSIAWTRWTRFYCSQWPLGGFRNLGLTRGARSVT